MTSKQPDIVFFWHNLGWGEADCDGAEEGPAGLIAVYATSMADQIAVYATSMADQIAAFLKPRNRYVSK